MRKLLLALAVSALAAYAANVTGKWSGSFIDTTDGQAKNDTAYMLLTQNGSNITGSVGPSADHQLPIKTGTIDGNKVKLEVVPPGDPAIIFELTLDGDRMTGDAHGESDGQKKTAKIDVKREP